MNNTITEEQCTTFEALSDAMIANVGKEQASLHRDAIEEMLESVIPGAYIEYIGDEWYDEMDEPTGELITVEQVLGDMAGQMSNGELLGYDGVWAVGVPESI